MTTIKYSTFSNVSGIIVLFLITSRFIIEMNCSKNIDFNSIKNIFSANIPLKSKINSNFPQPQLLNKEIILNSEEYRDRQFTQTRIEAKNEVLICYSCRFYDCQSQQRGGAISSSVNAAISHCTFDYIKAPEAGCIYSTADVSWIESDVYHTKVSNRNGVIGTNGNGVEIVVNGSLFTQVEAKEFCLFAKYYGKTNIFHESNATYNDPNFVSGAFEMGFTDALVDYSTFANITSGGKNLGIGLYQCKFQVVSCNFLFIVSRYNTEQGMAIWVDGNGAEGTIENSNFHKVINFAKSASVFVNDGRATIIGCCFDTQKETSLKGKYTLGKGNSFSSVCYGPKTLYDELGFENIMKLIIFGIILLKLSRFFVTKMFLRNRILEMRTRNTFPSY